MKNIFKTKKQWSMTFIVMFYSLVSFAQDCPSIIGVIKTTPTKFPETCLADVFASPSAQTISTGETTAISLVATKPNTTYSWTVTQVGLTGATSGTGNTIRQQLTNIGSETAFATYVVIPKLGNCSGAPVTIVVNVRPLYRNIVKNSTFTKNNCGNGAIGSTVIYTVAEGTYTGTTQLAADALAENDSKTNGQAYADANGTCSFENVVKSGFVRDNCAPGGIGSAVVYTVGVGKYRAATQAAADLLAQNDGQAYANANGTCTFSSTKSGSFTKNNCDVGGTGSVVVYSKMITSIISQEDADTLAQDDVNLNGQANANKTGTCSFGNVAKSGFVRNNCAVGGIGSAVVYTVAAGKYRAATQAAADLLAENDGQAYANANGTCTFTSTKSGSFTKNNCGVGGTGSMITYSKTVTSSISQADADSKAQSAINVEGPAYANVNGTCSFSNVAKSGFVRNNCAAGGTGSAVVYTVTAGKYIADTQAAADLLAENDGQAYANANGTCTFSSTKSGSFTKNNCGVGGTGSVVVYSKTLTSIISQADADSLAQADVNQNGQANANTAGTCSFGNVAKSGFVRNNCAAGGTGSAVVYTVTAGKHRAATQAAADLLAENDGQAYANANGTCMFSSTKSGSFTKNNCGVGGTGSVVVYSKTLTSIISQADADTLAQADVNQNGQTNANTTGTCSFGNVAKSGFVRNNCAAGGTGSAVVYTVTAGKHRAATQAAADLLAENDGQAYANANGTCTFSSTKSGSFTKNNCGVGGTGSVVVYSKTITSIISQADADTLAQADVNQNGQANANTTGTCSFGNVAKSGFVRNNCAAGGTGSVVVYTVTAGKHRAATQAAADLLAENDGQAYANANGTCTFSSTKSGSFTKNNCGVGGTGSVVVYSKTLTSIISQADADTLAQADVNQNGQANANTTGACSFGNVAKSGFVRNNCAAGGTGSTVVYTVTAGKHRAATQAAADLLAENDGQAYANANGTCTFSSTKSGSFTKNNCGVGGTG
ncbi:DUF5977 domain-containing protein, partial [Flavobacterium sp. FlaQc-49]|uniref:DUF5977 domain-containing protein n=1 Tax=Flavobacterium sp. FlaQc-49 TaxID=3374182 RepID=UPI0037564970